MDDFIERIKNEPTIIGALVVSLLLTLGAWKVLEVTPEQLDQTENFVTLLVTVLLPLLTGLVVRSKVMPVRKLEQAGIDIEIVGGRDALPKE